MYLVEGKDYWKKNNSWARMTVQAPSQGNDLGSDTVVWTFKKEEARRLLIPGGQMGTVLGTGMQIRGLLMRKETSEKETWRFQNSKWA